MEIKIVKETSHELLTSVNNISSRPAGYFDEVKDI